MFFDEIDALGQARGGGDSNSENLNANCNEGSTGGSRRLLAEILIQMTALSNEAKEIEGDGFLTDDRNNEINCGSSTVTPDHQALEQIHSVSPHIESEDIQVRQISRFSKNGKPRLIVIAATNRPEDCDSALLRRFAVRVLVGLPSQRDRKRIIRRLLTNIDNTITANHLNDLAIATDGWSGSDLESLTR